MENLNSLDLSQYKAKIPGYKLSKQAVINQSYTAEDALIVGLRVIERDRKWYLTHNSQTQAQKIAQLQAKIRALGGEPDEE